MAGSLVKVELECLVEQQTTTVELLLPSSVSQVLDIKKVIEDNFNIPVGLQTIRYGSTLLRDDLPLDSTSLLLTSGDTLHVSFHSAAQCEEIGRVIDFLETLLDHLCKGSFPNIVDMYQEGYASTTIQFHKLLAHADETFSNKVYFHAKGGLALLTQLHMLITNHPWDSLTNEMKWLECEIMYAMWNMAGSKRLRLTTIENGGLQICLDELLRVPIVPREDDFGTAIEVLNTSTGALTCLCEVDISHMLVATNKPAMEKLCQMIQSPLCASNSFLQINSTILCLILGYSPETHPHLVEAGLLEVLIESDPVQVKEIPRDNMLLLMYYKSVFFSQIALHSVSLISSQIFTKICSYIAQFLQEADPVLLSQREVQVECKWATFIPYVKMAYLPGAPCYGQGEVTKLQELALETIMVALEIMLDRQVHRDIVLKEGLMDFITSMPWYTTGHTQNRAKAIVRIIQQAPEVKLQPPSLVNMAKACVAKNYCGLPSVVQLSAVNIVKNCLEL